MKYTPEITQQLIEAYRAGQQPDQIAENLGVPPRSVIAKLSSLGIYQKKSYLNKQGETPTSKAEWIERISTRLCVPAERLESLEKSNKQVLELLYKHLQEPT